MESTTPLPMESRKVRFRFQAENRPGIYAAMLSRFSDDLNVQFNFEAQRLFSRRRKSGGMSVDMVEVSFNLELKDRLQLTQARNIITRALAGKGRIIEEAFVIELPERL